MATNGTSIRTAYPASYKDHVLTANIKATAREARSCLMNHYSAGIYSKYYFGYQQMSKTSYITNPEDIAGPTGGTLMLDFTKVRLSQRKVCRDITKMQPAILESRQH